MTTSQNSTQAYLEKNYDRFLTELCELLSIPSISNETGHEPDIRAAADWLARKLQAIGVQSVEVIPTERHPLVYGQALAAGPSAPTVLIYGHYDVQSPEPLEDWKTPPFEPTVIGENLFARGATDMKGQVMASIAAVEAMLHVGHAPVNVKFLIEGEEEIGSVHIADFVTKQRERLACDCILNPDAGEMPDKDTPSIAYALRGGAFFRLKVFGPRQDLHSGLFGGVVENPINALSALVAGLHDEQGRITLPGFYDSVRALDDAERLALSHLPFDDDYYLQQTGVPSLWGEQGYSAVERIGARPTADVLKFEAGQHKAAIPAKAEAYISFRLVPDQDPEQVDQQFRRYLEMHAPSTIRWELERVSGGRAVLTSRDSRGVRAMQHALQTAFGHPPILQRVGGSIRAQLVFNQTLGVDSVLTGFSLFDDNLHGPNEKIHLPTWKKGMSALAHFFYLLPET